LVALLHEASRLVEEPRGWESDGDRLRLELVVAPHSVTAVTLELPGERSSGGARR
jgi:hypothetical protein